MFTDEELARQVSMVAQMGGTESVSQEETNDMEMALAIFKSYQVSVVTMFTCLSGPSLRYTVADCPTIGASTCVYLTANVCSKKDALVILGTKCTDFTRFILLFCEVQCL
jgi:hypothetical protein